MASAEAAGCDVAELAGEMPRRYPGFEAEYGCNPVRMLSKESLQPVLSRIGRISTYQEASAWLQIEKRHFDGRQEVVSALKSRMSEVAPRE
jgi:hypothetical protein